MEITTSFGKFIGNERKYCDEFLGIPYAHAARFRYAEMLIDYGNNPLDATKPGPAAMQKRKYPEFEHLEVPERKFYHREFREGITFDYEEDALNLNIYVPKEGNNHPVIVFIHGGGFDSGSINESCFDGEAYAKRNVILVTITYRVGVFGYLCDETLAEENGHDGNFGLDDQVKAITWVKNHIAEFGGNPDNITLMGQSAGAMAIQYMCLSERCIGLFKRVILMSGGGKFPDFSLPKKHEENHDYAKKVMLTAGCKDIREFEKTDAKKILEAIDILKKNKEASTYHMMPCVDGYYLTESVKEAIKNPMDVGYMLGFTNCDMFTLIMANMTLKYANKNKGYCYYFDVDAKGDKNHAFHSSDLRYAFGTLDKSWRPYTEEDYRISEMMIDYFANYAKNGNPNGEGLPEWKIKKHKALHLNTKKVKMSHPHKGKLLLHTFHGDPQ